MNVFRFGLLVWLSSLTCQAHTQTIPTSTSKQIEALQSAIDTIATNYFEPVAIAKMNQICLSTAGAQETTADSPAELRVRLIELSQKSQNEPLEHANKALTQRCLPEIFKLLNTQSEYIEPDTLKHFRSQYFSSPRINASVGVRLSHDREHKYIQRVIKNSPADRVSIKAGDLLLKINGQEIKNFGPTKINTMLNGTPNSDVSLEIQDASSGTNRALILKREEIHSQSTYIEVLAKNVIYTRIHEFDAHALKQLKDGLNKAIEQTAISQIPMKGIILDLRDNPGGTLNAAIGVAAAFIKGYQPFGKLKYRKSAYDKIIQGQPEDYGVILAKDDPLVGLSPEIKTLPLRVLIDRRTMAGAEISSAILQDRHRALVVGESTLGRGTVAIHMPITLKEAMMISVGQWIRVNGLALEGNGITPDQKIAGTENFQPASEPNLTKDTQLRHALENFLKELKS